MAKWSEVKETYDTDDYDSTSNDIDVEVATSTDCPCGCGRKLQYAGYRSRRGGSYIAVAYCEHCDYAEEF
jgi:hypothetical protein